MGIGETFQSAHGLSGHYGALIDWWALAGVDEAVTDDRCDWFAYGQRPATPPATPGTDNAKRGARAQSGSDAAKGQAVAARPASLAAHAAMVSTGEGLVEAGWFGPRIGMAGPLDATTIVLTDMPSPADRQCGNLLSGEDGMLVDAMLAACGLNPAAVLRMPLCHVAPPGGAIPSDVMLPLAQRAQHLLSLSSATSVLVLGDATNRALRAIDGGQSVENPAFVNHHGAIIQLVRIAHPRTLAQRPKEKAQSWRMLRLLAATKGQV